MDHREFSAIIRSKILKIEGARLFKRSKTPEIRPRNGRISAVLGYILIKLPWISLHRSEGPFRGDLVKKY